VCRATVRGDSETASEVARRRRGAICRSSQLVFGSKIVESCVFASLLAILTTLVGVFVAVLF